MIVAYGASGSGKTYSMFGDPGDEIRRNIPGFQTLAAKDILESLQNISALSGTKLYVSYYEVYLGKIYDLFN